MFRVPWPKKVGSLGIKFIFYLFLFCFAKHDFNVEKEQIMSEHIVVYLENTENTVLGFKVHHEL